MDNGQKFYVMMNLKLFHACAFCSTKGVVMYSDFKIEGRSKIPHKNCRNFSLLFQHFDSPIFFDWTSVHLSMSGQK